MIKQHAILQVTPFYSYLGGHYFFPFVLCEKLIAKGIKTELAVLDNSLKLPTSVPIKKFHLGFGPKYLGRSPLMARYLIEEARSGRVDIIHNHGLWMMPNVYPGWARAKSNCKLVVSTHGMIAEWALNHHALRKKLFWWLLQRQTFQRADAFHATAESEYQDVRRLGFRQPVFVIPSGIDVPPLEKPPLKERRQVLYLGRVHKKKGVDLLLRAWAALEPRFSEWELVVAGPDDGGYLTEYQALAERLRLTRMQFVGPLYGEAKLQAYRQASIYVLPAHSENFGITVAEALAAGTPAIVTKGAPWAGLQTHGAGWWIDIGVDPLVAALEEALASPEERLREMGRRGREWMERDFSWAGVAEQMAAAYAWLLGQAPRPTCVKED